MKASFLAIAVALAIAASAVPSTARDKFGPWGPPVNLGPIVNSTSHDERPAISRDDLSLYFDSNRQPGGFGGYDIWSLIEPASMIPGAGRKTSDP